MNARRFGGILLLAGVMLLAIGGYLWATGVPDDGTSHAQTANPLELIVKNRALIERRNAAYVPLLLGAVAAVIGGAVVLSTRRSVTPGP